MSTTHFYSEHPTKTAIHINAGLYCLDSALSSQSTIQIFLGELDERRRNDMMSKGSLRRQISSYVYKMMSNYAACTLGRKQQRRKQNAELVGASGDHKCILVEIFCVVPQTKGENTIFLADVDRFFRHKRQLNSRPLTSAQTETYCNAIILMRTYRIM